MKSRVHTTVTLVAFALGSFLTTEALAQDASELRDDELLAEIVVVTEAEDADRLLELMLEVKTRGLLMFQAPKACEFTYPDTAFFENEFYRGAANWAYVTELKERAISEKFCGCHYKLMSFDAFSQEVAGKAPEALSEVDDKTFSNYRRRDWYPTQKAYDEFRKEICGVEPWQ
jgi:hypothetical protein